MPSFVVQIAFYIINDSKIFSEDTMKDIEILSLKFHRQTSVVLMISQLNIKSVFPMHFKI